MQTPHWYRPESDRYLTLDALRFLAACAIVLFHYGNQAAWTGVWTFAHAGLTHLQMAVDLFFVISGVLMADLYGERVGSRPAYLDFLRRRFARLGPLHYATFGLVALAAVGRAATGERAFDTCGFGSNVLMLQAFGVCHHLSFNKPSWSISAEMALYLALPLFLAAARSRMLAWGLVAAAFAYALVADPRGWPDWLYFTYDFGVLRGMPAFLTGILLARTPALAKLPAPRLLLGLCLALLVVECTVPAPNAVRVATLYLVAALGLAVDRQGRGGAVVTAIAPLSRLTYSVYMLQHLVAAVLVTAIAEKAFHLTGSALNLVIAGAGLVVLPAVSVLSLVAFEGPARRWISGRGHGAPAAQAHPLGVPR